ncbi:MAG TPA: hypothetical protein VE309_10025 [Caulobacteraceae bacterium]|jgi:hypothetical protein|nr:hypothetical protein [Caulobacteraceae bacterium]
MLIFMRVEIPVEAGNAAIASGDLPKVIQAFADKFKPEALHFASGDGMRTIYAVFDMADASDIPSVAEPFFTRLKARIDWQPCMDLADLRAGLAKL